MRDGEREGEGDGERKREYDTFEREFRGQTKNGGRGCGHGEHARLVAARLSGILRSKVKWIRRVIA